MKRKFCASLGIFTFSKTHWFLLFKQKAQRIFSRQNVGAANIQISTCTPNFLILEGIKDWKGFYADILNEPIQWDKGYVIPPTKPGLGVELNEDILEKYSYKGTKLHLEMAEI